MSVSVLSVRGLAKKFGGRSVLREVDLDLFAGEVHGLVGQNGSGKSTFIKILAGYHAPEPGGSLQVAGRPVPLPVPARKVAALGLCFVHQDLGLSPQMTVLENLRVGDFETGPLWRVHWRRERATVRDLLDQFGLAHVNPDAVIADLREVDRARIAIARALHRAREHEAGLLVLDEPTVYLPRSEADRLFATVRAVTDRGFGVLFVSHRLDEVRAYTDRVTVFRDGALVATAPTSEVSEQDLLERILGRVVGRLYPAPHDSRREVRLSASLQPGTAQSEMRLDLHRGEIVGVTGLLGMGHDTVPYMLFGARPGVLGEIVLDGARHDLKDFSPRRAINAGLALVPGDRLSQGSMQLATVRENVTLPTLSRYFQRGLLRTRSEGRGVREMLDSYQVVPPEPDRVFNELSGGNQQKALIAKWFQVNPQVLLLHEPTQGVDVGARQQIFERIRNFAQRGGSVLIASVEYEDLANLCDRVIVFRDGRPASELRPPQLSEATIVEHCFRTGGQGAREGTREGARDGAGEGAG